MLVSYCHTLVALTVGSPALAAFSLAHTALNTRWIYNSFSAINHPNRRNAAKALINLQQAPLCVTTHDGILASLIVLPENDGWWKFLAERLKRTHTWTIAAMISIVWAIFAVVVTIVDSFTSTGGNVGPIGLGISSLWLWLIPIVVGWLWIPVFSHDELKAAIGGANKLAFVATDAGAPIRTHGARRGQAIGVRGTTDVFTADPARLGPMFNYSRTFAWSLASETIIRGFQHANGEARVPDIWRKWVCPEDVYHREDRIRTTSQVQAYCGFPAQGDKEPIQPVPSGIWKRIFIASAFALGLQWGTIGSAVISTTFTSVPGLGCRSMPFILYGIVSTITCVTFLLSSCLAHFAKMRYDSGEIPDPGFNSTNLAKGLATFLRWLSIFAAGCNALGVVLASTSQSLNSYSTCYYNSTALGCASEVVRRIIATGSFGYDQVEGGWIGGIVLACGCVFVFLLFLSLMLREPSYDIDCR